MFENVRLNKSGADAARKTILYLLIVFGVVFFRTLPSMASADPSFRLEMDSLNLQKGVSGSMVVSMVNAQNARIVSIDGLENFDVLSQGQSSYTSMNNNTTTYQLDIRYTIMPKVTGRYTLKANIDYNGQMYETNPLEVNVTENSGNQGAAGSGSEARPDLFVEMMVSHEEAYLGEKIIVTYLLYTRYNVESLGFTDQITVDGALVKEMPNDQVTNELVYIDGNRYAKYEMKQLILDPVKPGAFTIPSFNLQVNVIMDDPFGGGMSGFFRTTSPKYLQTDGKELMINPLPTKGRPDDFSGIVGTLELEGGYSRKEVNYGDSLVLEAKLSGSCNLDGLKKIINGGIPGFSVYETLKYTGESVESGQYHARKEFDLVLVPERNGDFALKPVAISYFDPVAGAYKVAEIPVATIRVWGEMPLDSGTDGTAVGSIETIQINQVNYSASSDDYFTVQIRKEVLLVVLIALIVLIGLIAGLVWMFYNKKKRQPVLHSLYKQLTATVDVNEIYNLFNEMVKFCFAVNLKACSRSVIRTRLAGFDAGAGAVADAGAGTGAGFSAGEGTVLGSGLADEVTAVMDCFESAQVYENNGYVQLKEKVIRVYERYFKKLRPKDLHR